MFSIRVVRNENYFGYFDIGLLKTRILVVERKRNEKFLKYFVVSNNPVLKKTRMLVPYSKGSFWHVKIGNGEDDQPFALTFPF